jgi:hypothetical protein
MKVIYTFPFVFCDFPQIPISFSPLQKGPDGKFGLAIEPVVNFEKSLSESQTACSFFEFDILHESVFHHPTYLPYFMVYQMLLWYDSLKQAWFFAGRSNDHESPLDVYHLPHDIGASWHKIFEAHTPGMQYENRKDLIALWQRGKRYPFVYYDDDFEPSNIYEGNLCWTEWRPPSSSHIAKQPFVPTYQWLPYVFDEGCLFFSCQCHYDKPMPAGAYWKSGPGHWQLAISAYKLDGTFVQQNQIPDATLPLRHLTSAEDDFINWLKLHMSVSAGPPSKHENKPTCIAALVMQDAPGFRGVTTKRFSAVSPQDLFEPKGGLYWVDLQGNILQHDASLVGEQISTCLCGETVVGTHLHNGERFLWTWSPSKRSERTVHAALSSQVQRATLVATEKVPEGCPPFFWCLEEYEQGIRVVQREGEHLQELQAVWCEGMRIPDPLYRTPPSPYLVDKNVQGVAVYQDTLLVLAVNQEKQLQLLQFQ